MSLLIKKNGFLSPFNSVTSDLFGDDFFEGEFFNRTSLPAVNVKETNKQFDLELAAPGLNKRDFSISVDNGILRVSAETKKEEEKTEDNYTRREFSFSKFSRSFTLPEYADKDAIDAEYENGVLKLSIMKKEGVTEETAKKIAVK